MKKLFAIKNRYLVLLSLVLITALLAGTAGTVSASGPSPLEGPIVVPEPPINPGSQDSFFDIMVNGGAPVAGWCVQAWKVIKPNTSYNVKIYDYYKDYYPSKLGLLTYEVSKIPWRKIAYIINHKQGTFTDVQHAIWYITDKYPKYADLSASARAMVNGAIANPNYVPGEYDLRPIIYFTDKNTQMVFSEYGNEKPGTLTPELPSGLLLTLGLGGIGGIVWLGRQRKRRPAGI